MLCKLTAFLHLSNKTKVMLCVKKATEDIFGTVSGLKVERLPHIWKHLVLNVALPGLIPDSGIFAACLPHSLYAHFLSSSANESH